MTTQQIHSLHHLAVALRPDWHNNRCGSTWQHALETNGTPMTLPHAEDFHHAIQALIHYATATTPEGTHRYKTPNLYVQDGTWWSETRPAETREKQPPCEQHPEYGTTTTCTACISEYKTGDRPENMIGKTYHPTLEEGHPAVGRPR
jgi:hypothetical protein